MTQASPLPGRRATAPFELVATLGETALLHEDDAERVGRIGKIGIEAGGLLEFGDSGGQVVLELEGEGEVVVKLRIVAGRGARPSVKLLDGVVEVALLDVSYAEIFAERRAGGSDPEGAEVERDGGFWHRRSGRARGHGW